MTQVEMNYCAQLVEYIRKLVRAKHRQAGWDEAVGEACDQLIMKLQPIKVIKPDA